ncbi:MAG: threonyl-tRNA synthetase [Parcubacteria group bacterium LiPW_15]|nr:MAG: threonyl-tRNA synthetase [Parcubacteria group bacterium LiPW_15]
MDKNNNLDGIRHSLAHLLAAAVRELYPGSQNAIGPAIENGFYQDFEMSEQISDADLLKIETKMRELLPDWKEWDKKVVSLDEVKKEFGWNKYKIELAEEFAKDEKTLTFFTCGGFIDLCKGGHNLPPAKIDPESFKLERVAGAYWRGDEKNKMLTRIYGLAFGTKEELGAYLKMMEEAKKRDHKKLGPELDIFVFSELVGPGLPLWTPKGTLIRNLLDDFVWELREKRGYEKVEIPHITKKDLYEKSGHWEKYKDDLFKITTREGHQFAMKPMNCPHHTQIYARKPWSYRELPQRYANTTTCYRDEQTGELSGLSRVRAFAQDDAHVFCRMEQAKEEFLKIWDIIHEFYPKFGFDLRVRLSIHDPANPEKYLGNKENWDIAEKILRDIVTEKKVDWFEGLGEAAFYGPKLDFMAKDSLGREWQVATIQLDMNMPERFDLICTNEKGEAERIVMIHAAIMGSIERFLSIAIEHFAGAFPLWLAPVQAAIIPVGEKFAGFAEKVMNSLTAQGIRAEIYAADETLGKRVREAEMQKIPYVLVVGEKEESAGEVNVRHYRRGQEGTLSIKEVAEKIKKEIDEKTI